jgi:S-adenosylmethionine-diacylglycerol 3-amino-3-carboxypropyl transferase
MLTADPARVIAVDLSPAQIACLQLRVSAYRALEHAELLELIGSRPSTRRWDLYRRCRDKGGLPPVAAAFWNAHAEEITRGIGEAGKFESYFRLFRQIVLPLVHSDATVLELLRPRNEHERHLFYDQAWDTRRWRLLFRIFFSRFMMARLGRDPSFFKYVEGSVSDRILGRARYALRELDPSANPYVHWILTGTHAQTLPLALRPEHFEIIRSRLDRIEIHLGSIESWLDQDDQRSTFNRFNLSDIFEYMSESSTEALLARLASVAQTGGRLLYWNMLAPRSRPDSLRGILEPLSDVAAACFKNDNAFFYSRLVIEEVRKGRANP